MMIKGKSFVLCIGYWPLLSYLCHNCHILYPAMVHCIHFHRHSSLAPGHARSWMVGHFDLLKTWLVTQHHLPDLVTWQYLCPLLINLMQREDCIKSQKALLKGVKCLVCSWRQYSCQLARSEAPRSRKILVAEWWNWEWFFVGENCNGFRHLKIM